VDGRGGPLGPAAVDRRCGIVWAMSERHGLREIPMEECLRLLAGHHVHLGRIGIVLDGEPVILPMNYRYHDGAVVVRTGWEDLLEAAGRNDVLAFQVDSVDVGWEEGWSVLVRGRASEVVDPDQVNRLKGLPLRPWAPGERDRFVRIPATQVTGRRIA
jgi:uncharacterized protein